MPNWTAKTAPMGLRCWWNGDICIVQHAKRVFWAYKKGQKAIHGRYATLEEAQAAHP